MTRPAKISLIVVGVLLGLFIAALIIVPMFINPNEYKPLIQQEVKKATGRTLEIQGDIELSLFPWIGVEMSKVTLSNAPGFGSEPMVSVNGLKVKVKLIPLIGGSVEMDDIVIDDLNLNLARNKQGVTNWDDIVAKTEEGTKEPEQPQPQEQKESGFTLDDLVIGGLYITDLDMTWDDRKDNVSYALNKVNLQVENIEMGESWPIKLSMALASTNPSFTADLDVKTVLLLKLKESSASLSDTEMTLDLKDFTPDVQKPDEKASAKIVYSGDAAVAWETGDAKVGNTKLVVDASGALIRAEKAHVEVNTDFTANWKKTIANIPKLHLVADVTKLVPTPETPPIDADVTMDAAISADWTKGEVTITDLDTELDSSSKAFPSEKLKATLKAKTMDVNWKKEFVKVANLVLDSNEINASVDGTVQDYTTAPKAETSIVVKPFSPRKLLDSLGLESIKTTDPKALASAAMTIETKATQTGFNASKLNIELDQTQITGSASVDTAKQGVPNVAFDLVMNEMDVDRYLPPESEKEKKETPKEEKAKAEEEKLPFDDIKKVDLDGRIKVDKLKVMNVTATNILVRMLSRNGKLTVSPFSASLYGGHVNMALTADGSKKTPDSDLELDIGAVKLAALMRDMFGHEAVGGIPTVKMNAKAQGDTTRQLLRTVTGSLYMALNSPYFTSADGKKTEFKGLSGNFDIKDGKAYTTDLTLVTKQEQKLTKQTSENPLVQVFSAVSEVVPDAKLQGVTGDGSFDIPTEGLDYDLNIHLSSITLPVKVTGTVDKPVIYPDMAGIVKESVKGVLKLPGKITEGTPAEAPVKAIEEGVGGVLEGIGGIFGGGKKKK